MKSKPMMHAFAVMVVSMFAVGAAHAADKAPAKTEPNPQTKHEHMMATGASHEAAQAADTPATTQNAPAKVKKPTHADAMRAGKSHDEAQHMDH